MSPVDDHSVNNGNIGSTFVALVRPLKVIIAVRGVWAEELGVAVIGENREAGAGLLIGAPPSEVFTFAMV